MTGEFELIEQFLAHFDGPRGLVLGPGDDCALLRPKAGEELALTTDAIVDGVHFTSAFTPKEIGHKALAVNLSDLAAMGARPVAFLCALALPERDLARLPGIARGMARLARQHRCALAGGNFTRAEQLSITITAIGSVPAGEALRRDGAKPGDLIVVSGELGGASAALRSQALRALQKRQRKPEPLIALGLAARTLAHAAIDISDGLIQDLGHILEASGVGATLEPRRIPLDRGATPDEALSGGEDYELVLCVPPRALPTLERRAARLGVDLHVIGQIERQRGLRGLGPAVPAGHDHFRSRRTSGRS